MRRILYFLFFIAVSCGIAYDGETRLVSEFSVKDRIGNPASGVNVRIGVNNAGVGDEISNGVTDANGRLRLIFPAPSSDSAKIDIRFDGAYLEKTYVNIRRMDFVGYKFALNDVVLYKFEEVTSLNITLNQVTATSQIGRIRLDQNEVRQFEDFHPVVNNYPETNFTVVKNSTLTILYTVYDNSTMPSTATDYSVPISIGENPVEYTLTY